MMVEDRYVSEATDATFETEVLERSRKTAVIVDFWAPWCAPCRSLTPILERAVAAREGRAWLVKVDVDSSPELAAKFDVRGVPAVKAFIDGRVVDEFMGARDGKGVEAFLDIVCPSPEERALQRATEQLDAGSTDGVKDVLAPAIESPLHRDLALLLLARCHAMDGRYDDAEAALEQIPEASPERERARALELKLDMMRAARHAGDEDLRRRLESDPRDTEARWALAGQLLDAGKVKESLDELLELLIADRSFKDDGARRAMLAIFDDIGIHHELSHKYRKLMQIYL